MSGMNTVDVGLALDGVGEGGGGPVEGEVDVGRVLRHRHAGRWLAPYGQIHHLGQGYPINSQNKQLYINHYY